MESQATYNAQKSGLNSQLLKLPPQAIELEEAVLGAALLEKGALTSVIDMLRVDSFYKDAHGLIWQAIVDLFRDAQPIDILTVVDKLRKNGTIEAVGGPYYIQKLANNVVSSANIEFHTKIIVEKWIKREIIRAASNAVTMAFDDTTDSFTLLDDVGASLSEISNISTKKGPQNAKALVADMFVAVEHRMKSKSEITGVPSGIDRIDKVTGGWQNSDLIIIAARPAMGKTSFVLTCLRNAAIDHNIPGLIFSLEMSSIQLITRLASSEAEINGSQLQKGLLEDYQFAELVNRTGKLAASPLWVDDTPGISLLELRAKARRFAAKHGIKFIVVDYLQLMTADTGNKFRGGNREQEIATISRGLKGLAKELNIPVIALSQLSRAVESRGGDKRPQLSDLRESGAIEQDADMVSFLYRPEYYGITHDEGGQSTEGYAEYIISKHRNGSIESVGIGFEPRYTRFLNINDLIKTNNPGF